MPFFESDTGKLVVHIVYDGAPFSGKTETVRALGRLFGREVESPKESSGRTLFFDWLEYEGGQRFGRPIVCRVLTVPGQERFADRRARLIEAADAVVFVADSDPANLDQTVEKLANLRRLLAGIEREIPVVLQLNKRDLPNATPAETLFQMLEGDRFVASSETTATQAEGVREAFVFAVSNAVTQMGGALPSEQSNDETRSTQPIQLLSSAQLLDLLKGEVPEDVRATSELSLSALAKHLP